MSDSDIVVVAKRNSLGQIYEFTTLQPGLRTYSPRQRPDESGENPDADYVDSIYVGVAASAANRTAAREGDCQDFRVWAGG
jgi:hypothetical protein